MYIERTRFIGTEGASFERVGLAFLAYGYQAPTPDTLEGHGAYVSNIVTQYQGTLSEASVLALIEYGMMSTRETLQEEQADPDLLIYTLDELTDHYLDQAS